MRPRKQIDVLWSIVHRELKHMPCQMSNKIINRLRHYLYGRLHMQIFEPVWGLLWAPLRDEKSFP